LLKISLILLKLLQISDRKYHWWRVIKNQCRKNDDAISICKTKKFCKS